MIHTIHPWVVIWVPLSLLDISSFAILLSAMSIKEVLRYVHTTYQLTFGQFVSFHFHSLMRYKKNSGSQCTVYTMTP